MSSDLDLSGPGLDLTNEGSGYNMLHPDSLLLPHYETHRASILGSCCVGPHWDTRAMSSTEMEQRCERKINRFIYFFFFLMFVFLFLFSLILRASSLIYWRLTNQWLFHSERLLFIALNVTKIWLILQQSILALLQKSHNFSVERDSYPDNYSQVYSGDRSESNTFSSVKISPE